MNIVSHFYRAAQQFPGQVALVEKGRSTTYSSFFDRVMEVRSGLKRQGVKPNDNVLVVIPLSGELYAHILALFSLGANVVLVDSLKPRKRLLYAFNKANCSAVVTVHWIARLKWLLLHPKLRKFVQVIKGGDAVFSEFLPKEKNETALITFTSGSTGLPKAANRTHGFLDIQLNTIIDKMELTANDSHLTSFPVVLMCNLAVGAASILPPKKSNQWSFVKTSASPSVVSASPFHMEQYLSHLNAQHIRNLFVGGASVLPHFFSGLANQFTPAKMQFIYGSTEAEPISTLDGVEYASLVSEPGIPVGRPHPNIQVRVVNASEGEVSLLIDGNIGEIIVAGPHVLSSYYKDEEAQNENKIEWEGALWHRTGDAGYFKGQQLFFLGRWKYTWLEGDARLSPIILEKFLSELATPLIGTWLHIEGQNIAFVVRGSHSLTTLLAESFPYTLHRVIVLRKMPYDKRHQSRIDYEKLIRLAKK